MDAGADSIVAVVGTADQGGDHGGVLALAAGRRAILAVAGDVEDRPHLGLEPHSLVQQLFAAGVVLAGGQRWQRLGGAKVKNVGGTESLGHAWRPIVDIRPSIMN